MPANPVPDLHFDVSTGLKRVIGRELITDAEVAIFELVKNSFDASAKRVQIYIDLEKIVVIDDGDGMSFEDIRDKWLFVAYSAKREVNPTGGATAVPGFPAWYSCPGCETCVRFVLMA